MSQLLRNFLIGITIIISSEILERYYDVNIIVVYTIAIALSYIVIWVVEAIIKRLQKIEE